LLPCALSRLILYRKAFAEVRQGIGDSRKTSDKNSDMIYLHKKLLLSCNASPSRRRTGEVTMRPVVAPSA
jgi:hypothetical protein